MTTWYCFTSGLLASDLDWKFSTGWYTKKLYLQALCGISAFSEQHSWMEVGGACYSLFEVDDTFKLLHITSHPDIAWVCLVTDSDGFEHVEEWTENEYTAMQEEFETLYEECNDDDM
jgi:hypothetical protein